MASVTKFILFLDRHHYLGASNSIKLIANKDLLQSREFDDEALIEFCSGFSCTKNHGATFSSVQESWVSAFLENEQQ
jgi:hypothetical protein